MSARTIRLAAALACAAWIAAASSSASAAAAPRDPGPLSPNAGTCGACHPAERVQHDASAHAREGVKCVSCHGGNDHSLDQGEAHRGFVGRITRAEEPKICASCHSDEAQMRPYDLPVDQYALYQTSDHGKKLAQGDTKVAVCSSCHGAHDIRAADDPASRTYVTNIPRTCGECHGDPKKLGDTKAARAATDYAKSVHAHELFDNGNRRAPTCVSCHGVHGASPPAVGDVSKVCGRCHTAERRYFMAGGHNTYLAKAGYSECAWCHGHHDIATVTPEKLESACAKCHGATSPLTRLGARLFDSYKDAAAELDQASAIVARADAVPIRTEDYLSRVEEGRTLLREALPAAHSLDSTTVASFTSRAKSVAHEVRSELKHKLDDLVWRKVGLVLFWFYVGLTLLVLRRFRERSTKGA